jgi:hypothetical protein
VQAAAAVLVETQLERDLQAAEMATEVLVLQILAAAVVVHLLATQMLDLEDLAW